MSLRCCGPARRRGRAGSHGRPARSTSTCATSIPTLGRIGRLQPRSAANEQRPPVIPAKHARIGVRPRRYAYVCRHPAPFLHAKHLGRARRGHPYLTLRVQADAVGIDVVRKLREDAAARQRTVGSDVECGKAVSVGFGDDEPPSVIVEDDAIGKEQVVGYDDHLSRGIRPARGPLDEELLRTGNRSRNCPRRHVRPRRRPCRLPLRPSTAASPPRPRARPPFASGVHASTWKRRGGPRWASSRVRTAHRPAGPRSLRCHRDAPARCGADGNRRSRAAPLATAALPESRGPR